MINLFKIYFSQLPLTLDQGLEKGIRIPSTHFINGQGYKFFFCFFGIILINFELFLILYFFRFHSCSESEHMNLCFLLTFLLLLTFSHAQTNNTTSGNTTTIVVDTNQTSNTTAPPTWLQQSSTQLDTFMSDQYNYFVTPGGNKVWVCTMSLAWNQMKRGILQNKNAMFQNTTTLQDKIVSNLNSQLFTRKQLSEDSYYVSAGFGQEQVDKINAEARQKFPDKPFLPLTYLLKDDDFISYAYLEKLLKFKVPFSKDSTLTFKKVLVDAFCATNSKQRKQLYFKYYDNSEQFLMGIESTNPNDEILILKTNRTEIKQFRMEKVIEIVQLYQALPKCRLKKYDIFKMPVVSFDYKRNYLEMVGAKFMNEGFQDYRISAMYENLIFSLDKSGIKAMSQAVIIATRTMAPKDQKMFLMNNDFWIILKQKNKKPYLIISVASLKQNWTAA